MIDLNIDPSVVLEFVSETAEMILGAESGDSFKKEHRPSFDKRADDIISKPSNSTDNRLSARKASALDQEFWESQA